MKVATKGHKSDWFERPANVVGVNVCRVSGKLPNAGCSNVVSSDEFGNLVLKSMIYTDYFVKGTQPDSLCPVHASPYIDAVAASASTSGSSAPHAIPSTGDRTTLSLPTTQGTSGVAVPSTPGSAPITGGKVEDPQPKKKGFWSRLFGRGDKDKKEDEKKKADETRKRPGG